MSRENVKMKVRIVDFRAFNAGVIFTAIGTAAFILAHQYTIGSMLDMEPGFFPAALGILLIILGLISMLQGIRANVPISVASASTLPVLMVVTGVVSFGLLIDRAGLLVSLAALIGFACYDRLRSKPLEVLVIYVALAALASGLFIYAFQMPIKLVWWH